MLEIMSPNVTFVSPLWIRGRSDFVSVKLHPRGIIEIDTIQEDDLKAKVNLCDSVQTNFEDYEAAGHLYPVNVTGLTSVLNDAVGSHRFCSWDGGFARVLTSIINSTEVVEFYKDSMSHLWKFEQVSKYFRFMRYDTGGEHFPHYDSDFNVTDYAGKNVYSTKYSLVMYFNDCESGELAFIDRDPHNAKGETKDWPRQATEEEIFLKIKPRAGKIMLFPHDVCHTVLPFNDPGQRLIARGDLIFTEVRG